MMYRVLPSIGLGRLGSGWHFSLAFLVISIGSQAFKDLYFVQIVVIGEHDLNNPVSGGLRLPLALRDAGCRL